jgi:peptidoglycan/LPS O-acetylase OafA/YrhL
MKRIQSLDSLRAIAAFGVIAIHYRNLLPFGWIGVQFFFVLSGFLITGILQRERSRARSLGGYLGVFFKRRSLRLLPLYALFLALMALVFVSVGHPASFRAAAPYLLTYSYNLVAARPDIRDASYVHLWSLAVESQFYLVWPFVIWSLSRDSLRRALLVLLVMGPAMRAAHYFLAFTSPGATPEMVATQIYFATWTHLDAFAMGGLLTFPRAVASLARRSAAVAVFLLTALAGGLVLLLSPAQRGGEMRSLGYPIYMPHLYQSIWGYSLLNVASAVVIALVLQPEGFVPLLLEHRWLRYLGEISYGIYVYHSPVAAVVAERFGETEALLGPKSLGGLLVVTSLTLGAAHVSYRYYERFFLRLKDRGAKTPPSPATISGLPMEPALDAGPSDEP